VTFEDLLPRLMVEVKGCPHFTAEDHLRDAVREFCERTHVWTVTLASFNTQVDVASYALALPAGSSLVRLSQVDVGDERDVDILDQQEAKTEQGLGSQSTFVWLEGATLFVNPTPTQALPVVVQLSLKPSLTSESVPDWLAEDHASTLRQGAKATLLAMPKVDWSDPGLAEIAESKFRSACNGAALSQTKGRAAKRRRAATFF
jgi:hypothetical protein